MSETDRVHTNRRRAESFGADAHAYDRARPDYPAALVDDLLVGRPVDALDVGCGTGKAARMLAGRGVRVVGVEVDARMAHVARSHGIEVEVADFESWDSRGRRFDLVVSGQAWHWIDPIAGAHQAADLLRAGGRLAVFWNIADFADDLRAALVTAYRQAVPELGENSVILSPRRGIGVGPHVEELRASGRFADVDVAEYRREVTYGRDEWLELISTHSDHSTLPAAQLGALLAAVGLVIDERGGMIDVQYVTEAVFARVRAPAEE